MQMISGGGGGGGGGVIRMCDVIESVILMSPITWARLQVEEKS